MEWVPMNLSEMSDEEIQKYKQEQLSKEEMKEGSTEGKISFEDMLKVLEMAYAKMLQGRFDEAESLAAAFLALFPDFWYFHSLMGAIHLQAVLSGDESGKFSLDEAESALDKAFELNPKDVSTYVNRAEVRLHKGDLEGAFERLRQVMAVDPEGKDPYTARARQFTLEIVQALERIQAGENIEDG